MEAERFPAIGMIEGTIDFLDLLARSSLTGAEIAPVCMAGAGMAIPQSALPRFAGKLVRIFVHADDAGRRAAKRWADQLSQVTKIDQYECAGDLNDMADTRTRDGHLLDFGRGSGAKQEDVHGI